MSEDISAPTTPTTLEFPAAEVAIEPTIVMIQPPYPLTEVESLRLDRGPRAALSWSMNVLLTGVGAAIAAIAPAINNWVQGKNLEVDRIQLSIAICTILFSGIVWLIVRFIPGDYEKTMRKIKQHFQDNPAKQRVGVHRNE